MNNPISATNDNMISLQGWTKNNVESFDISDFFMKDEEIEVVI